MLKRSDTFNPVCFLYASLSGMLSGFQSKNGKEDTGSDGQLFQFSDKKTPSFTRTQIKIYMNSQKTENEIEHFCQFPRKETFFLHFKITAIVFDFILQFWRIAILLNRTLCLSFQVAICNQPIVISTKWLSDRGFKSILRTSKNYWFP